ncbi:MAG: flagellar basal body P-ring formation chaperone FlgA [Gemmataceae bacterium]|nr:flagellar basal body P-ring formation chaperone FlgA [Gemmataceae bacterium]
MTENEKFTLAGLLAIVLTLVGISFEFTNAAPPSGESDWPTMIVLKSKATTAHRVISIGDVAQIVGGSTAAREKIAQLDLADIEPGQPVTVKLKQLEFRLKLAEIPTKWIEFKGESECIVVTERKTVEREEVFEVAKQAIYRRLSWKPEEVVISLVQPISVNLPLIAPTDEVSFKAEPQTSSVGLGRVQINVTIFVKGERKLSLPIYCEVKLLQSVAILKRPLNKGDVLQAEMVSVESKGIDGNQKPASPESVVGRKLKKPLPAGVIIQVTDLEDVSEATTPSNTQVLVKANKPVKMIVHLGTIDVIANGEALADGKLGDRIKVRNVDSKKILTGRVSDFGVVVVE